MDIHQFLSNKKISIFYIKKYFQCFQQQIIKWEKLYQPYKSKYDFFHFVKFYLLNVLEKKCKICNKELTQKQINLNKNYCSYKCAMNIQQVKKRNLQLFGYQFPSQSPQLMQKKKKNNLIKYGVEHVSQLQSIKKKIKQTSKKHYGVDSPLKSKDIRQQIKKTNLQKYGCQYGLQSQIVKNKIRQSIKKKYGVDSYLKSQFGKKRVKEIMQEKYGQDNYSKTEFFRQKIKKHMLQKYNCEHYSNSMQYKKIFFDRFIQKIKQYVQPCFDINQFYGITYNGQYCWRCVKCGNIFKQKIHTSTQFKIGTNIPRCLKCYPYVSGVSYKQQQIRQFIDGLQKVDILNNVCYIIPPHELDIYIPQKNIAIQYDGLYWHGEKKKKSTNLLIKTQKCLEKGIQLIHVFQNEWLYKQDIVKDRIKNILGIYDYRIYARKCKIKQIKPTVCKQFLDSNHLQGSDNSKIRLGLFYKDQLISVMTFSKPRFNKNYEYELVRFASKLGIQVIGGASKLLKYFERKYNPKSLISYADRRYSNGKLYYVLGFQFSNNSEPNYLWYKQNKAYSRYQCQKHKLKKFLGQQNFKSQLSESENMYNNNFFKIYDCGNIVFVKKYN